MSDGRSGLVGQSVKRVEDRRLLTGSGSYVADIEPPGCTHAAFLRSPYPHAEIVSIDVDAARRHPGVVAVFTGTDMQAMTIPFLPFATLADLYTPLYHALAVDRVRMVGDPVAIVIAESRYVAEDAMGLIDVEYEPLAPVATIESALSATSTPIWPKADGNVLYDHTDAFGDVDAVFAAADRTVTETFRCQRQSNQPMETRGTVVEIDPATGDTTVYAATQSSHMLRWQIAAFTEPVGPGATVARLVRDKQRRQGLFGGAKAFIGANQESLQAQDNAGMASQVKAEPATLKHMGRAAANLAGKERFVTVKARDIGGGFGAKGSVAREDIAVAAAAFALNRTVKWIEDRVEHLQDGGQAREEDMTLSMAVDDDGTIRGLKVDLTVDHGAYPGSPVGAPLAVRMMKVLWPGSYRWDAFVQRSRIVSTNKGKYVAYRGPWANETWTRERMLNIVARELGMTQTEIRRKNMFGDEHFPAAMITGPSLDVTMSTRKTLDRAIELADLEGFAAAKAAAADEGRLLGIGFASYHEAAPGPPDFWDSVNPGTDMLMAETARVTIEPDGVITVRTSQMPHGQSHETTYAQVLADQLGVGVGDVTVLYGDTSKTPFGLMGTGASRGGPIGGGAVRKAGQETRRQVLDRAADMLEAAVADLDIVDGNVHVAGVPARGISIADVAAAAASKGPGEYAFDVAESYTSAGDGGWSCATHVCWVEVDRATGLVEIARYLVVEDCGPIINPAIVDGQVRGGVAQGVGAVLYERTAYDEDANIQSTTYMDYLIPTSMEIPPIEIEHLETLSPGENDYRGVGEGGMLGAPAAITNAIEDAIGVTVTEQHLPPAKILELLGVIEPD
jgi:carbon-monoxide dehydrogenase large subunit